MLYLCGDIMDKKPVIKKGSSGEMTDWSIDNIEIK